MPDHNGFSINESQRTTLYKLIRELSAEVEQRNFAETVLTPANTEYELFLATDYANPAQALEAIRAANIRLLHLVIPREDDIDRMTFDDAYLWIRALRRGILPTIEHWAELRGGIFGERTTPGPGPRVIFTDEIGEQINNAVLGASAFFSAHIA